MKNFQKLDTYQNFKSKGSGPAIIIAISLCPIVSLPILVLSVEILNHFIYKENLDKFKSNPQTN